MRLFFLSAKKSVDRKDGCGYTVSRESEPYEGTLSYSSFVPATFNVVLDA